MKPQCECELVDVIVRWVSQKNGVNGYRGTQITAETDLMESELLDSFGFVELMMFIEGQTGRKIDLTDVDPSEFSVVRGLSSIAFRNGR